MAIYRGTAPRGKGAECHPLFSGTSLNALSLHSEMVMRPHRFTFAEGRLASNLATRPKQGSARGWAGYSPAAGKKEGALRARSAILQSPASESGLSLPRCVCVTRKGRDRRDGNKHFRLRVGAPRFPFRAAGGNAESRSLELRRSGFAG